MYFTLVCSRTDVPVVFQPFALCFLENKNSDYYLRGDYTLVPLSCLDLMDFILVGHTYYYYFY